MCERKTCSRLGCNRGFGMVRAERRGRQFCSTSCLDLVYHQGYLLKPREKFFTKLLWRPFSWLRLGSNDPSASTKVAPDIRSSSTAGMRIK
ncbi:MAG: hypothetical protein JWL87_314 [Candidatus Adlerbacteria bacterium]|nr:hypothetical protein [Candidatus Adlerbacteria bacterium]